jgi:hypothetical protein
MTGSDQRSVFSAEIRAAVKGHETDLLDALNIDWRRGPAGTRWVGSPGNWRKGPDGEFGLDNKGKRIFDPTVDFKDRAAREKLLDIVLEALRHVRPELFQHGAGEAG